MKHFATIMNSVQWTKVNNEGQKDHYALLPAQLTS